MGCLNAFAHDSQSSHVRTIGSENEIHLALTAWEMSERDFLDRNWTSASSDEFMDQAENALTYFSGGMAGVLGTGAVYCEDFSNCKVTSVINIG